MVSNPGHELFSMPTPMRKRVWGIYLARRSLFDHRLGPLESLGTLRERTPAKPSRGPIEIERANVAGTSRERPLPTRTIDGPFYGFTCAAL